MQMARKSRSLKVGQEVKITFWDHGQAEGTEATPFQCVVYGRVIESKDIYYVLAAWDVLPEDHPNRADNQRKFTIIKSSIIRTRVF
jgi:hypothetical protein